MNNVSIQIKTLCKIRKDYIIGGRMERILKVSDIQNHLGISKNRAYELIKMKTFPKIQIGHRYYIPENEYNEWIKKNTKHTIIL